MSSATTRNLGIARDPREIVGDHPLRQRDFTRFGQILHHYFSQCQLLPGVPRKTLARLQQQAGDTAADGSQTNQGDLGLRHRVIESK